MEEKSWYAVHTYSGYENKVKTNLEKRIESMNMEEYIFRIMIPTEDVEEKKNDKDLEKDDKEKINSLGGFLPKIADVISRLEHIDLPDCYLKEDLPTGGVAYLYCTSTNTYCGRDKILIHKDTAQILVAFTNVPSIERPLFCPQNVSAPPLIAPRPADFPS